MKNARKKYRKLILTRFFPSYIEKPIDWRLFILVMYITICARGYIVPFRKYFFTMTNSENKNQVQKNGKKYTNLLTSTYQIIHLPITLYQFTSRPKTLLRWTFLPLFDRCFDSIESFKHHKIRSLFRLIFVFGAKICLF